MKVAAARDLPVHILAPYVVAAAATVIQGDLLDDTDLDALIEAECKLETERLAAGAYVGSTGGATLASPRPPTSLEFATLVLEAQAVDGPPLERQAQNNLARTSDQLAYIVGLLQAMRTGDKAAAESVSTILGRVVDRIFGHDRLGDI